MSNVRTTFNLRIDARDIDPYLTWCLFSLVQTVTNQMSYLEHLGFPLAIQLWTTIGGAAR